MSSAPASTTADTVSLPSTAAPAGVVPATAAAVSPRRTIAGFAPVDLFSLITVVVIWASLHPIAKRTLEEITIFQLPFARVALGSTFLIVVCVLTGRLGKLLALFRPGEVWKFAILGLTGYSASSGLSMAALGYLPAGINSVLANASPLMVALGVILLLRERLAVRVLAGLVIGFLGVAIVALRGGVDASGLSLLGVMLSLVSSGTWALYTVLARRLSAGHDLIAVCAATSLLGALPLALVVGVEGEIGRLLTASTATYLSLLWCGVIATGATFTAWVMLLRRINATRVASFQYMIPLGAQVMAFLIGGELPTLMAAAGALMIVGGVAVANSATLAPRKSRT
ncbi:MAG: DMT family transporter [Chloroflexi bacterium]|nr:DMT family transporter [Chloroflexota bacterium]